MNATQKMPLRIAVYACIAVFLFSCASCSKASSAQDAFAQAMGQSQQRYKNDIAAAIAYLDSIIRRDGAPHENYLKSRKYFKQIEPWLAALDKTNYSFLNQPNMLAVDEEDYTDIKLQEPSGYQVLEELLFESKLDTVSIAKHSKLIAQRLRVVQKNNSFSHLKPYHFLWMFRNAFIRVGMVGITGFDSPELRLSLQDSQDVYRSLLTNLEFFASNFRDAVLCDAWQKELAASISALQADFETFDRYRFIQNHTHKQLQLWNKTVADWQVEFPFTLAIQNDAESLFSAHTFNIDYFSDATLSKTTNTHIRLGKKLFNDPNLSANQTMRCASCHQADKAFSDGLKIRKGQQRNSPTLLYAGLQQGFFYDKRAGSLEGQILAVVENENEFHSDFETLKHKVLQDSSYHAQLQQAYPNSKHPGLAIRHALSSYVRSLQYFDSKFDRNINKKENTLTPEEISGFNLFMGKAQCATCHFPPVFNGTRPPDYSESELEQIGVPNSKKTANAEISADLGRYLVYQTIARKHYFKTPTLRNSNQTSPYMHNGVYDSLEEVVDFYNRGGGVGIGIAEGKQSLPTAALQLTTTEQQALVAFLKSLDEQSYMQ